jgi:hypothetical protein
MNHDLNQIERLDWAAKALTSENLRTWGQIYVTIWFPLVGDWAHLAQQREAVYIAGAVALVVTLMLWQRHRYAILALAVAEIAAGGAFLYIGMRSVHDPRWRAMNLILVPVLFHGGYKRITEGTRFLAVQSEGWAAERVQVRRWLNVLQGTQKDDRVVEIKDRILWMTSLTHRFFNTGNCWAMATFKKGEEKKLPTDYRIRFLSEITLTVGPDSTISAQGDGKTIPRNRYTWN